MFSAKGFSPVQSGLLANQNVSHFHKSKMMMQFAAVVNKKLNGVGIISAGRSFTLKVLCQDLEDKSDSVPEPDFLQMKQRQAVQDFEDRMLEFRLALALAEKRLRDTKEAVEATKRNIKAAQELLKKKVDECDSDMKEAFEAKKGKENAAAEDKELIKKKVDECDCDVKEASEAAKGNENAAGDQELLEKKDVGECENDVKS